MSHSILETIVNLTEPMHFEMQRWQKYRYVKIHFEEKLDLVSNMPQTKVFRFLVEANNKIRNASHMNLGDFYKVMDEIIEGYNQLPGLKYVHMEAPVSPQTYTNKLCGFATTLLLGKLRKEYDGSFEAYDAIAQNERALGHRVAIVSFQDESYIVSYTDQQFGKSELNRPLNLIKIDSTDTEVMKKELEKVYGLPNWTVAKVNLSSS